METESIRDEYEQRDVVIVGGGITGLTAAWRLRDHDVLLLEAEDRLGGRLRSDLRGDHWLNFGAHLFPAPGSLVDSMVRDCGLRTASVTGSMMGLAVGSKLLDRGRVETYPVRVPLSVRDKLAFAAVGLKIRGAVKRYHRLARAADGETPADVRARLLAYEGDRTFGEFLGTLPPAVAEILSCAAHRATAELAELSAGCGIGLFALVWGGRGSLIARNVLGGAGQLPAALGRALGARTRTRCRVRALHADGADLVLDYLDGGTPLRVRARQVIVAAQAPFAAALVAPVARDAGAALERMTYGAFLSVAAETREQGRMPWDGVYAMATPGRVFDMFTNQGHALRGGSKRRPGGSLMLFAGAHRAAALARESDAVIVERFLADLHTLYPQTRGVIADARVHRWPLGNVYAHPGRARLQAPLEGALGPHRNLHLAGDYFAELGNMEAAARTGAAAAARVDAQLQEHLTHGVNRPSIHKDQISMPDQLQFHGVLPALITPFTDDGSAVDGDALTANVEHLIGAGVGGIVPGASTGEFTTLSHAERRELVELTVDAAAGRVPVVAGTGALSTAETVELSVHAQQAGAAAVMIVPPFYDALSWRELLAHYTAVADRISIPIMYYNLPSASGVTLSLEQFRELRAAANVTTLKDTGGDATAATELIQAGGGPTLLNGWDTMTFAALAAGVRAVVWGTASIIPEQCVELHRLLIDDIDLPAARELWARVWPLCSFLEAHSYSAAVKAACALVGQTTGPTRAPLLPLDDDATAELAQLLERTGARLAAPVSAA